MSFCPICKGFHNSNSRCYNKTDQILKDIGIDTSKKKVSSEEFKKSVKEANKVLILICAIVIALFVLMFFLNKL
jgi:hypothetical protein